VERLWAGLGIGIIVFLWAMTVMSLAVFVVPERGGGLILSALAIAGGFVAPAMLLVLLLGGPGWQRSPETTARRRERELFLALRSQGTLTAETLSLRSSLTVEEAGALLENLAESGHLEVVGAGMERIYRTPEQ
jgi:hypothetical protein